MSKRVCRTRILSPIKSNLIREVNKRASSSSYTGIFRTSLRVLATRRTWRETRMFWRWPLWKVEAEA